jgi:hypothetical protein
MIGSPHDRQLRRLLRAGGKWLKDRRPTPPSSVMNSRRLMCSPQAIGRNLNLLDASPNHIGRMLGEGEVPGMTSPSYWPAQSALPHSPVRHFKRLMPQLKPGEEAAVDHKASGPL